MRNPQKIRVEVLSPSRAPMYAKNCKIDGNEVIISRGRPGRGNPPITTEFDSDCIIHYSVGIWPFRRLKQKLLWIEGTDKCCGISDDKQLAKGRLSLRKVFEAGVMKNQGATLQKTQLNPVIYFLVGANIVLSVVGLLVMSGRLIL